MTIEQIKISAEQAMMFKALSGFETTEAKLHRKRLWQAIRAQHGLPANVKYKVATDAESDRYMVICEKESGLPVGQAKSNAPYGHAPIANIIPRLAVDYSDTLTTLPLDATPIGGGLFAHKGELYFPIY